MLVEYSFLQHIHIVKIFFLKYIRSLRDSPKVVVLLRGDLLEHVQDLEYFF